MEGLATLIERAHPVDRDAWPLLAHPRLTESARLVLYGVRYWTRVKAALLASATSGAPADASDFAGRILTVAEAATRTARVDADLLIGITAAAMAMHDQLGRETFARQADDVALPAAALLETPTMVLRRRARNSPEGLLSALPGVARRWTVTREPDPDDRYVVEDGGLLAACRGGDHALCEVAIVAGAHRVSPMSHGELFPVIRRACETRVFGRVSLLAAL